MAWIAGVDGCRAGWCVVLRNLEESKVQILTHFAEVLTLPETPAVIAVDIPIGILEHAEKGGRECDRQARRLLRPPRASSVFSPPVRATLIEGISYEEALRLNRETSSEGIGISRQCYGLIPKLIEVHSLMTPELQGRVHEIHPELSFFQMAGHPMLHNKQSALGRSERRAALQEEGFGNAGALVQAGKGPGVGEDDVLDAMAACWTARRIDAKQAIMFPAVPPADKTGLRMEMWR